MNLGRRHRDIVGDAIDSQSDRSEDASSHGPEGGLAALLSAPAPKTDRLEDARTQLLRDSVRLLGASTSLALVLLLFLPPHTNLAAITIGFVPFFVVFITVGILAARGKRLAGALLLVGGTTILQFLVALYAQGNQAQALVVMINLVLIAGFTLGPLSTIITSIVASIGIIGLHLIQLHGMMPAPVIEFSAMARIIALVTSTLTTGGLVTLGLHHVVSAQRREDEVHEELSRSAELAALLVELSRRMIEEGRLADLAEAVCRSINDDLELDAWIVSGQGTVLASTRANQDGEQQLELGPSPESLETLSTEALERLAQQLDISCPESGLELPFSYGDQVGRIMVCGASSDSQRETHRTYLSALGVLVGHALARLHAERQLGQAQKLDAVGRLSAGIAHDFNNALTTILGNVELAQRSLPPDNPVRRMLEGIDVAGQQAAALTRKLLAFSQHAPLNAETFDVVARVAQLLPMLPAARLEGGSLEVTLPDHLIWVRSRPVDIEQVVLNLLLNAVTAIRQGGTIRLDLRVSTSPPPGLGCTTGVCLSVSDDGVGIPASLLGRIFEPFFTTGQAQGGTGLGLAVTYGLVKTWGGEIRVHSEVGVGSRFEVWLPEAKAPVSVDEPGPVDRVERAPNTASTVLLVEDSDDVRAVVKLLLESSGFTVVSACDGVAALDLLARGQHADLVLSDVVMPRLGGVELLIELRRQQRRLPVVLVSGNRSELDDDDAFLQPFEQLAKPFRGPDLVQVITTLLEGQVHN